MLFQVIELDELVHRYKKRQQSRGLKPLAYYLARLAGDQEDGTYEDIHRGLSTPSEMKELDEAFKLFQVNPTVENQIRVYEEMGDVLFLTAIIRDLYQVGCKREKEEAELLDNPDLQKLLDADTRIECLAEWGWSIPTAQHLAATKFSLRLYRQAAGLQPKDKDMEWGFLVKEFM